MKEREVLDYMGVDCFVDEVKIEKNKGNLFWGNDCGYRDFVIEEKEIIKGCFKNRGLFKWIMVYLFDGIWVFWFLGFFYLFGIYRI